MNKTTDNNKQPTRRAYSLDALRGYAILTMVLSAPWSTAYCRHGCTMHRNAPNPCLPARPGRTDLGGPCILFFLFAMGAAFPFSLRRKYGEGLRMWQLAYGAVKRGVQLMFFAIFIQHFYPLYAQCTAGRKGMAVGIGMLRRTVPHVHAHTVEDA
ncbi:MAG: DUF5009 domain-containing protein [Bacteroides stercoris]